MDKYVIAPPSGSTNNSVGAGDRPWAEGYFDSVKLNGGDLGSYLAESTGYGIVSGCEPSISGLTVTVGAGIVHLAAGTRKEIAETNITLDAADSTNPRIDLVYITADGAVTKVTGTAAASPSAPALPSGGISVAQVSVAANASTGTITDSRDYAITADKNNINVGTITAVDVINNNKVRFLFPRIDSLDIATACNVIITPNKVLMIDSGNTDNFNYIISWLKANNITSIDMFLLTHYHLDHFGNIAGFLAQSEIDFSHTKWLVPCKVTGNVDASTYYDTVIGILNNAGADYTILSADADYDLSDTVKMKLMCAGQDLRDYMANQTLIPAAYVNGNQYSIYALIQHKNVNALFAGDGTYPETVFLYDNYDLPKCHLYRVAHHGGYQTTDIPELYKKISPDYAVYDMIPKGASGGAQYILDICHSVGARLIHLLHDCELVSDGDVLINKSTYTNEEGRYCSPNNIDVYVDSTFTGIPDGTQDKPFITIRDAINFLGAESFGSITVHCADGTYENISVIGVNKTIILQGTNVTIPTIDLSGCAGFVSQITNLTVNKMAIYGVTRAAFSKVTMNASVNNALTLDSSIVYVANLSFVGTGTNATTETNIKIQRGILNADTCSLNSAGTAITVSNGATFAAYTLSATNVNYLFKSGGDIGGNVFVSVWGTLSSLSHKYGSLRNNYSTADTVQRYGTPGARPTEAPTGHIYYDSTNKKCEMWNGSAWIDIANGNVVS